MADDAIQTSTWRMSSEQDDWIQRWALGKLPNQTITYNLNTVDYWAWLSFKRKYSSLFLLQKKKKALKARSQTIHTKSQPNWCGFSQVSGLIMWLNSISMLPNFPFLSKAWVFNSLAIICGLVTTLSWDKLLPTTFKKEKPNYSISLQRWCPKSAE